MRSLLTVVLLAATSGCLDQFSSPQPAPSSLPDMAGAPASDLAMAPGPGGAMPDLAPPPSTAPSTQPSMQPSMQPSGAPVDVSGALAADTTWSGSYRMTTDVIVPAGKTLTVAAGAQISAQPGVGLRVDGKLVVSGSAASTVLFTQAGTTEWYGLDIRSGGQLALSYATVEHVTYGVVCETGASA